MDEEGKLLLNTNRIVEHTMQNCKKARKQASKKLTSVEEDFPKRVVIIAVIIVICLFLGLFMRLVEPKGQIFKSLAH